MDQYLLLQVLQAQMGLIQLLLQDLENKHFQVDQLRRIRFLSTVQDSRIRLVNKEDHKGTINMDLSVLKHQEQVFNIQENPEQDHSILEPLEMDFRIPTGGLITKLLSAPAP